MEKHILEIDRKTISMAMKWMNSAKHIPKVLSLHYCTIGQSEILTKKLVNRIINKPSLENPTLKKTDVTRAKQTISITPYITI